MSVCSTCGREHVSAQRQRPCKGHRSRHHPTDPGGPCAGNAMVGQEVCGSHGGRAPQNRAKGQQREQERKVRAALGDAGEPVKDPVGQLMAVAGRAVRFMEQLGGLVDQLDGIGTDESRAQVVVYGRSIEQAARVVESIIRMGIAERLAKAEEQQTAAIVSFIDGVLADLGHNPRDPEVAGVVARRLELVAS